MVYNHSHFNEFQEACKSEILRLASENTYECTCEGSYQYKEGESILLSIGGVPLEILPTQVDITTPYNGRTFELRNFEDSHELIQELLNVISEFTKDPDKGKHPIYRLGKWVYRKIYPK